MLFVVRKGIGKVKGFAYELRAENKNLIFDLFCGQFSHVQLQEVVMLSSLHTKLTVYFTQHTRIPLLVRR